MKFTTILESQIKMAKYKKHKQWIYAMYKGEEFLCEGTKEEICKKMSISKYTFMTYRTTHYKNARQTKLNNRRIVIRIDGKDRIYG